MSYETLIAFHDANAHSLVVVLGTNEIASAVAVLLRQSQFDVVMSHGAYPPVIRRAMSFHDALYGDPAIVEGIEGKRAESMLEIVEALTDPNCVAVTPLHLTDLLAVRSPQIIIDARMQKHRVTPDVRGVARLAIGLGPNFFIDVNCDVAIETHPSKNGTIVTLGSTKAADGQSRQLGGVGRERFVYSDRSAIWHTAVDIGMRVFKGFILGHLDGRPVVAPIDGILRGIARDGTRMPEGVKLAELDARGRQASWSGMDERGRAIAEATLEAIRLNIAKRGTRKRVANPISC